jgi:hypothetical protein
MTPPPRYSLLPCPRCLELLHIRRDHLMRTLRLDPVTLTAFAITTTSAASYSRQLLKALLRTKCHLRLEKEGRDGFFREISRPPVCERSDSNLGYCQLPLLATRTITRCSIRHAVDLPCESGKHVRVFKHLSRFLQASLLCEASLDKGFDTAVST